MFYNSEIRNDRTISAHTSNVALPKYNKCFTQADLAIASSNFDGLILVFLGLAIRNLTSNSFTIFFNDF